jgi:hypothetical protein
MSKPRLSTGRFPFQLGIDAGGPPGIPIVAACAVLMQATKPIASLAPFARSGSLYQQPKPIAALMQAAKPSATLTQRSC